MKIACPFKTHRYINVLKVLEESHIWIRIQYKIPSGKRTYKMWLLKKDMNILDK